MEVVQLKRPVRAVTFLCGLALLTVLMVPLWQIQFDAPQYPEGLTLKMDPNKLAGNVDIINGLNHYIGMKTLHTKDFIEFTVLPYLIIFFAAMCFLVAILNKRKWLTVLFVTFLLFGIIAMADFWRWEYHYGHDLNPNAAIQIPGMVYQPPLLGYKQLLNFGVYSIPDTGGWIFITVGILLLAAVLFQWKQTKRPVLTRSAKMVATIAVALMFGLSACNTGPVPIHLGVDACSYCKMSFADQRFGAEIITKKGKVFKFDDMHCMLAFRKANIPSGDIRETYVVNFEEPHNFIPASKAFLLKSEDLHSPMGGDIACFTTENKLLEATKKFKGNEISWEAYVKQ